MIIGVGIDIVEIQRFDLWYEYSDKQLLRIFSEQELLYCRAEKKKSAERFGVRFAAKEAFFKSIASYAIYKPCFFFVIKLVQVIHFSHTSPIIEVDWNLLKKYYALPGQIKVFCSLSHSALSAYAMIILES